MSFVLRNGSKNEFRRKEITKRKKEKSFTLIENKGRTERKRKVVRVFKTNWIYPN